MIAIDIPQNPNCEAVELRVFHDLESPRAVSQVRFEREPGKPQWCDIVGWSLDNTAGPAWAQKVDDSGEGVAFLIHGGKAGLRLRSGSSREPWQLESPHQWGLPFLIMTDPADLRFAPPAV